MLAAFVAAICITLLAPFVHVSVLERVCSATGDRLVAVDAAESHDGHQAPVHDAAAHCPLCLAAGMPPSPFVRDFSPVQPLAHVQRAIPAARLAGLVGAPLPARGPPALG